MRLDLWTQTPHPRRAFRGEHRLPQVARTPAADRRQGSEASAQDTFSEKIPSSSPIMERVARIVSYASL